MSEANPTQDEMIEAFKWERPMHEELPTEEELDEASVMFRDGDMPTKEELDEALRDGALNYCRSSYHPKWENLRRVVKRGAKSKPKFNVRLTEEELNNISSYVGDSFAAVFGDGKGLNYQICPPPWDEQTLLERADNLASLRVDPKSINEKCSNPFFPLFVCWMNMEVKTFRKYFRECSVHVEISREYFSQILTYHPDDAKMDFDNIMAMMRELRQPPHRNFLAYLAYCDFLEEFGFQPTMPRLTRFIIDNPEKYPVGIPKPPGHKEWWDMFFEAGLVRLARR